MTNAHRNQLIPYSSYSCFIGNSYQPKRVQYFIKFQPFLKMSIKPTITFLSFLLITVSAFAQKGGGLKEADQQFDLGNYREAVLLYKSTEINDLHVNQRIANCYYYLNEYQNAQVMLARVADVKDVAPETIRHYAEVLVNQKEHEKAATVFVQYAATDSAQDVAGQIESCKWAPTHLEDLPEYELLVTNIKTGGRSLGVAKYNEGLIYAVPQEDDFQTATVYYDLVYSKQVDSVTFDAQQELPKELSTKYYEGSPSVSADGKLLFFTRNASKKKEVNVKKKAKNNISDEGVNVLKLMQAQLIQGEWKNVTELPVNNIQYSCTHPSSSPDGKTLYFVSNMPGGMGGYDVYKITQNGIGEWSEPVNLGDKVNTKGHEMFPNMVGGDLYFASNGGIGFGGFDIYRAEQKEGKFIQAENAGVGINSAKDDFAVVFNEDGESGFISSNRDGDNGYDHVYLFRKIIYPFMVNAIVKDKISTKPIEGATIEVLYRNGNGVLTENTDLNGKLSFELYSNRNYVINFSKEGYEPLSLDIPAGTPKDSIVAMLGNIEMGIEVKKDVVINLDNIYFALAEAEPLQESLPILNRLVDFLEENPDTRIELSAHTDSRGGGAYNFNLSDRRAKACFNYLVLNDVAKDRIVPKGYGETKLLNKCADGVYCDEALHQKNRRVEIKIL